jgi:hypothetical protein
MAKSTNKTTRIKIKGKENVTRKLENPNLFNIRCNDRDSVNDSDQKSEQRPKA